MSDVLKETNRTKRFEFAKNWGRFLRTLNEDRISEAKESLKQMLEIDDLKRKSFLDIGSGRGLFSLAARRLGAKVHFFDYDLLCVACSQNLNRRYSPDDAECVIEQGDVLNVDYLKSLGQFDVVYSWGVLHHTGAMWQALENVEPLVAEGRKLYISIYNNQGGASICWTSLKKFYNRSSKPVKWLIVLAVGAYWETRSALSRLVRCENLPPFKRWAKGRRLEECLFGMILWIG